MKDTKTGVTVSEIAIAARSDGKLCVKVRAAALFNLTALDDFIGELITWRDRYAEMIEKEGRW